MKTSRLSILLMALAASACSGAKSTVAPTPPPLPTASIVRVGNLAVEACVSLGGGVFSCRYHAVGENIGAGCGASVSGVTRTFMPNENTPFDANQWTYASTVRPHEQFVYEGIGLRVPPADGWTYTTTFAWTDVRCP